MSDFALSWNLSRKRLIDEIANLNSEQLNWRPYEGALSIGQMVIHVAGVEVSFSSQLLQMPLDESGQRLKMASTEGVVNDHPFPFPDSEITPEWVTSCLEVARGMCESMIDEASPTVRETQIQSALGPIITGEGAFARLGFHSAYHQGQVYLMKTSPNFPR